jgi:hypothetical protein
MDGLVLERTAVVFRRSSFALIAAITAGGAAGCVSYQPWQLPDPYSGGSGSAGASSPYYYYGSGGSGYGSYGYGSSYYGGYRDPYYYRSGVPLPYPAYGYAPYYPGHSCWDNDRDGRCDRSNDDGRDDDDDDAGNGGRPRPDNDRPLRDVRRLFEERDQARSPTGSAPSPAILRTVPSESNPGGAPPKVRVPARTQAPPSPPPRAEPRRNVEPSAPARARGPRSDDAPLRGPRDDAASSIRRPLR